MSAPTPTERPSPSLPFWGLVWSSAVVGFVVGFQIPNYLGRVILGAAWLTTYPATLGFGALVGIGFGFVVRRTVPLVRSPLWLLIPLLFTSASLGAVLLGSWTIEWSFGYPTLSCDWALFEVEHCSGHDWSVLQDRHGYAIAEGRVDFERCRRFQSQVPSEPKSPVLPSGWIECPADDAGFWQRASCSELGQPKMSDCFVCAGRSGTSDNYSHAQGFDEDCQRSFEFYGKNTHPRDAARCSQSTRADHCPMGGLTPTGVENPW